MTSEVAVTKAEAILGALDFLQALAADALELENHLDARHQFLGAEGLGEIVVGAGADPFGAGFLAGARGDQHDGNVAQGGVRTQLAQQAEAVNHGHDDIGENDIGTAQARGIEGRGSVGDRGDFEFVA
jgi:hypothetical protein